MTHGNDAPVPVAVAPAFLPRLADRWAEAGVEMRCDRRALSILGRSDGHTAVSAGEGAWGQEFLSLVASVKVIKNSKFHAWPRPMGLRELTSYKWTGLGAGQVRP